MRVHILRSGRNGAVVAVCSDVMARTGIGAALGTRVRAKREACGWSQAKLAEVVDLTPNYVGALERGEALPTVHTLVLLAKALGTTPALLLGEPRRLVGLVQCVHRDPRDVIRSPIPQQTYLRD